MRVSQAVPSRVTCYLGSAVMPVAFVTRNVLSKTKQRTESEVTLMFECPEHKQPCLLYRVFLNEVLDEEG